MGSAFIETSRNSCALHGALATLGAIDGVVPVIHATAGCAIQYHHGISPFGGALPKAAGWGAPLSSANIGEKHVVFGGGSRLREQLKNTVKIVAGELYVVVSGCATEMVGDDIPAMAKEGREQGFPVIHASTPGFRGSVHRGYQIAVRALIEQLPARPDRPAAAIPGLVNVWGLIPQQDVFWQGHLRQLEKLLRAVGLTVNPLLGGDRGLEAWHQVPAAALNLVISPWGREVADLLASKYGTPWLDSQGLPIGPAATGRLLDSLTNALRLDAAMVAAVRARGQAGVSRHLAQIAPLYFAAGFQREFAVVGELALVTGVTEFLSETLGLIPNLAVVTDPLAEERRDDLLAPLRRLLAPFEATLALSEDAGEIADLVRASRPQLLIGSSLERSLAEDLDIPLLTVAFPLAGRLVLTRGYIGHEGAAAFLEDLGTAILGGPEGRGA